MESHRILAAAGALALALTPAAPAKPGGHPAKGKGKAPKARNVVVKGVVASNDGTTLVVTVPAAKGKGKGLARKPSGAVSIALAGARITAADANADGKVDAADVRPGDKVVVQTEFDGTAYAARHVVDQARPPADEDEQAPTSAPAPAS